MRRWLAVAEGRQPSGLPFATRPDFRRVLSLPFDCELVFSAERPVNTIPMMSVAFGQKGRCKMKLFEIPMFVTSLFGLGLLSGLDTRAVQADFVFGTPTNIGWGTSPSISTDGLSLYVDSDSKPGGYGRYDIWVYTRETIHDDWSESVNAGRPISSSLGEGNPDISADGLTLFFNSSRPGGHGDTDMWLTTRATTNEPWSEPVNLGPPVNGPTGEVFPSI